MPSDPRTSSHEPLNPGNPDAYPRAEDDAETFRRSPEFHDRPDPGPNVGREEADSPATKTGESGGRPQPPR